MVFFDWISPTMQIVNMFRGHKTLLGSAGEIRALEQHGINCYAPIYVGDVDGEYMWQVRGCDYAEACRILGGER